MSVEATVVYLDFLINRRRAIAEQAQAISSTAFRRGTPFTSDEKAAMDACFQQLQSLDDLIPRQQEIVTRLQKQHLIDARERGWRIVEARHKKLEERAEARRLKKLEKLETERQQALARQVPKEPPRPTGIWLTRVVAPRDDEVTVPVAEVDEVTGNEHGHYLSSQLEQQAKTLIAWRYKSLNVRHNSRRYEGYQRVDGWA
jgi:hypothetical protein